MVHRQTGAASSFRAYDGGGARALIDKIDDSPLMQAMTGQGMKGEAFSASKGGGGSKGPEAPQNYGFTSVVASARKGANGMLKQCAEGFMSFMGGNRSFPVAAMMDDRRHRLKNLIKDASEGSTAMHGMKEWGQQFLNTEKGMFMTGNTEKTVKFALAENQNGKTQQQSSSAGAKQLSRSFVSKSGVEFEIETFILDEIESRIYDEELLRTNGDVAAAERAVAAYAASSGGGDGGGGGTASGNSKPTAQKTLHKEDSKIYQEMDKDKIFLKHGDGFQNVTNDVSQTYHQDPKHDTRCDKNHVHIGFNDDNKVWVDKEGVWSSKPIKIRNCDDKNGSSSGPPATSGPPAYSASSPLALDNNGNMSMATSAPLAVGSAAELARHIEHPVPEIGPKTVQPLILNFKAPLFLDTDGFLTSTGGGASGVPEAPTNGLMYGRQNAAWARALAITGDTLDGGNF